jgi:leucyl-tRNA synthetase
MKKYDPAAIEPKWTKKWQDMTIYQAENSSTKEKRYILNEFPYPSGAGLHVGHVWGYTMGDVISRFYRMKGHNVLFPMGWDAFGLPAENYAIKTGIHPKTSTEQNIKTFHEQLNRLGLSFDWSREVNTTDPRYYKWTQWIFLQLYKKGLAYKAEMPINWCPHCKTGLANEEVTADNTHERCGTKVTRRNLNQWLLKITAYADRLIEDLDTVDYSEDIKSQQINWIGRSEGARVRFAIQSHPDQIEVFTTRIDTLPGVTFVVIAPEHPLVDQLTTKEHRTEVTAYVHESLEKSELERSQLQKEKTGVFTGSYAINPLTQEKTPIWIADYVLISYGTGAVMGVPSSDERDLAFAQQYNLPLKELGEIGETAAKKILSELKIKKLAEEVVEYKLRDWIFSRQHYWGEPIPILYCKKCGEVPVPESDLPVTLPEVNEFEPTDDGLSPLARVCKWMNTTCPSCGGSATRETDTMPNWAGSSWYFLRYTDPNNAKAFADRTNLDYFSPVDLYIGGAEHTNLHLLYSRFWHKFLFDEGLVPSAEPYLKRRNRGLFLGTDGRKMSKSFGNVINPDDEIKSVGADTLRMYELFVGPFNGTYPWNSDSEKGVYRFLQRVWELTQAVQEKNNPTIPAVQTLLHQTIEKVGQDIEKLKFNTAVAAMMEFINTLNFNSPEISPTDWKKFILILAPFAPFLTEELWHTYYFADNPQIESIHLHSWPSFDPNLISPDTVTVPIQVNGKLRTTINVPTSIANNQAHLVEAAKQDEKLHPYLPDHQTIKIIFVPGKLLNFVIKSPAD